MASSSPPVPPSPLPPSPSFDDLPVPPPVPPVINIPGECGFGLIPDDSSLDIFPPISPPIDFNFAVPPPVQCMFPESQDNNNKCYTRGRNRSRSRSSRSRSPSSRRSRTPSSIRNSPIFPGEPAYVTVPNPYESFPCRIESPVYCSGPLPPRRRRYSYRSRTPSPLRQSSYVYSPPQIIYPPPPPPMTMTPPPPPPIIPPAPWPPSPIPAAEPVDILIFQYNSNMAYAPVAKTYDEAIDNMLELWPELHAFDRDRIHLFVSGVDQLIRVPKMAWQTVMCDLTRYEIMHVQVDQLPPPPQYQSDGKGNLAIGDEKEKKPARSGGFFSSIKRIFWR